MIPVFEVPEIRSLPVEALALERGEVSGDGVVFLLRRAPSVEFLAALRRPGPGSPGGAGRTARRETGSCGD